MKQPNFFNIYRILSQMNEINELIFYVEFYYRKKQLLGTSIKQVKCRSQNSTLVSTFFFFNSVVSSVDLEIGFSLLLLSKSFEFFDDGALIRVISYLTIELLFCCKTTDIH